MTNLLTAVLIALLCLIAVFLSEPLQSDGKTELNGHSNQPAGVSQVWPRP